jgi:predicted ArsR family transcriptional regulator
MTDRIGEFLIRIKAMTAHQVDRVLEAQKAGDTRRFGDVALELGFVHEDAIKRYVDYLEKQEAKE